MLVNSPSSTTHCFPLSHVEDLSTHNFKPTNNDFMMEISSPLPTSLSPISPGPLKRKRGRPKKSLGEFSKVNIRADCSSANSDTLDLTSSYASLLTNNVDIPLLGSKFANKKLLLASHFGVVSSDNSEVLSPMHFNTNRFTPITKQAKCKHESKPYPVDDRQARTPMPEIVTHSSALVTVSASEGAFAVPLPSTEVTQLSLPRTISAPASTFSTFYRCPLTLPSSVNVSTVHSFTKPVSTASLSFGVPSLSALNGLACVTSPTGVYSPSVVQSFYNNLIGHTAFFPPNNAYFGAQDSRHESALLISNSGSDSSLICRLLPQAAAALYAARSAGLSGPHAWTPKMVAAFIATLPGCQSLSNKFIENEIDGAALLCLEQHDLMSVLNLKLGPAVKVFGAIKALRRSMMSIPYTELSLDQASAAAAVAKCFATSPSLSGQGPQATSVFSKASSSSSKAAFPRPQPGTNSKATTENKLQKRQLASLFNGTVSSTFSAE